ncbi:hypothetical protein [Candidatus Nitrotoga sp. BS]|uniref:hypothetical protein n=1 Tax=Candidatus Nitrotoga sp. BS TaxID=2890408 RepID=UPI001EF19C90|nr:hypothetical protein [Candidatus Nitrotoga sp. BS]
MHRNLQGSSGVKKRKGKRLIGLDGFDYLTIDDNVERHRAAQKTSVSIEFNVQDAQRSS